MASFKITRAMLNEGTMFVFVSWVCIINSSRGFNSHLADTLEPEASPAKQNNDLNEFVDNLTISTWCYSPTSPRRSRSLFSMRLRLVLHQASLDRIQSNLKNTTPDSRSGWATQPVPTKGLYGPSPSPHWRRTWMAYYWYFVMSRINSQVYVYRCSFHRAVFWCIVSIEECEHTINDLGSSKDTTLLQSTDREGILRFRNLR